jgi:hypothetical protein
MADYLLAYHGGATPETEEEGAQVMAAWGAWFESLGSAVVAGGDPTGAAKTVSTDGVSDGGGANPVTGYSIVSADSLDAAAELVKGCPVLAVGGSIEVSEIVHVM